MEIFDIVDVYGNPTGETVERTIAHETGLRHRTAHVWIARMKDGVKQVLLQKRSSDKDSFPGCYDTSSAGHIPAGDEPLESAVRELEEELGIVAAAEELAFIGTYEILYEGVFHGKVFKDNQIAFVYIYKGSVDEEKLTLQKEEVESVKWFDLDEVYQECTAHNPAFCVPMEDLELIRGYALFE